MARRLGDRHGLGRVMRAYWARPTTPLPDILEMLTEARALAAEIGDIEDPGGGDGVAGRALMALGDTAARAQRARDRARLAQRMRQPFILTSPSTTARPSHSSRAAFATPSSPPSGRASGAGS